MPLGTTWLVERKGTAGVTRGHYGKCLALGPAHGEHPINDSCFDPPIVSSLCLRVLLSHSIANLSRLRTRSCFRSPVNLARER